eukprot:4529869-Amphidinium_carterae.1
MQTHQPRPTSSTSAIGARSTPAGAQPARAPIGGPSGGEAGAAWPGGASKGGHDWWGGADQGPIGGGAWPGKGAWHGEQAWHGDTSWPADGSQSAWGSPGYKNNDGYTSQPSGTWGSVQGHGASWMGNDIGKSSSWESWHEGYG